MTLLTIEDEKFAEGVAFGKMYPVKWTHEFSTIPECRHSKSNKPGKWTVNLN